MSTYNNFELLLYAAAEKSCEHQTQLFLNIDSDDFEITPSQRKQFDRITKSYGLTIKRKINATRLVAVACLMGLAICLSACMCVPKIRNAIKSFFVEWYEDYIAVGFGEKENTAPTYEFIEPNMETTGIETDTFEGESHNDIVEESIPTPPSKIEKKISLTYLPGSYNMEVDIDNETYYSVSFYNADMFVFYVTQNTINSELNWANSESQKIYKTTVNGNEAIITEDINMPNIYTLIWQDSEYEYLVSGKFSDINEIKKVADGIILQ